MKYLFLIAMLLGQFVGYGQPTNRQLDEWDTLRIKTRAEVKNYDAAFQNALHFSDTSKRKNTVVINYYSADKKKLRTVSNHFDTTGCLTGTFTEYYNTNGLIAYQEDYKKCCNRKLADDERCFEYVVEYARYQYDETGRLVAHVYHLSTPMTIKETYTYSADGTKQVKREQIREPEFWK
jgi:DNA mismatch repair ATPase MutS